MALALCVSLVACGESAEEIADRHRAEYIESLAEFRELALSAGAQAEGLSGLVQDVWNDAIRDNHREHTERYVLSVRGHSWDEIYEMTFESDTARNLFFVRHGFSYNDFNTALALLSASSATIEARASIQSARSEVVSLYLQLGSPPEGLERAGDAASAMYEALDVLIDLANSPTGNFNSYSENRRNSIDEFMRNYRLLGDIIDTFGD